MARLGAFCFPGTGHINPMTALARTLEHRGHQLVIFGIADIEARVRAAGIEFHRVGESDYPPGTLRILDERQGALTGLATFRFTVRRIKDTARMILRDGPEAVRAAGVEALLVDEADFGGNVAEYLNLPFVSVAFFPPLMEDDRIPAFCFPWGAAKGPMDRFRNRLGLKLLTRVAWPIFVQVNEQRKEWGLQPLKRTVDALSPRAQIAQLPEVLEFAVGSRPAGLHYTGPFVVPAQRKTVEFPWERLDGRRLVYASLGTLQNGLEAIFRTIAAACAGLDAQLVISLGGGLDPERLGNLPGDPVVVRYAPQLEIMKRAAVVVTHAGLNTVLESLTEGVPMVMLPMGNDQPGVAARVEAKGAGVVVSPRRLSVTRLRRVVRSVLEQPHYRDAAGALREAMARVDGLALAADVIEKALEIGPASRDAGRESVAAVV